MDPATESSAGSDACCYAGKPQIVGDRLIPWVAGGRAGVRWPAGKQRKKFTTTITNTIIVLLLVLLLILDYYYY